MEKMKSEQRFEKEDKCNLDKAMVILGSKEEGISEIKDSDNLLLFYSGIRHIGTYNFTEFRLYH